MDLLDVYNAYSLTGALAGPWVHWFWHRGTLPIYAVGNRKI